ncbi:helix-turn-helix domain-containing protein [Nitrosovibrio sp. Nv17]|uniref:winged helix-turn-helix transcriptional regulator n=1 Tax=Nitrosovibrio sp. Nv17 TaxID=1855339 RepID=UPI000908947E|nr:helix-turn-helix domain-containing protein [Nitrosovibrio sp. Nv17]SFW27147.1 transcriptional regulator, HxlR family [Nitrosovibrio sp. Nv17]
MLDTMGKESCKRSACPINCALEILGDRWTLLIVRDIVLMRKRHYRDFLSSPEGIATNILSDRLRRLETAGILSKRRDAANARRSVYTLTEKGLDLIPVMFSVFRWGARHEPGIGEYDDLIRSFEDHPEKYIATVRRDQGQSGSDEGHVRASAPSRISS